MRTRPPSTTSVGWIARTVLLGGALALASGQTVAVAQSSPEARGIHRACPERSAEPGHYVDLAADNRHLAAIGCLDAYGIVQGRFTDEGRVYAPAEDVTRQQMASFIARTLFDLPDRHYALPAADDEPRFEDHDRISAGHLPNVNRLDQAGIVEGRPDGTYGPGGDVTRAQMASFIARALEDVTGQDLPRDHGAFHDVAGTHRASIEKLAAVGVVVGRADGSYGPAQPTSRDQMAAFIGRSMDYLAEQDVLVPMAYGEASQGATAGLTDVEAGDHGDRERVTFTVSGGEGVVGWRIRHVDEAIAHGSGNRVDVDGDAVIEVSLTGMALPPRLDDEELWDDSPLRIDGDQLVEVVDVGVYEGHHQLFVGVTGLHEFEVDRLTGPQRVYLDVLAPAGS